MKVAEPYEVDVAEPDAGVAEPCGGSPCCGFPFFSIIGFNVSLIAGGCGDRGQGGGALPLTSPYILAMP